MRRTYARGELTEDELAPTWWAQFDAWFATAAADPATVEANAMQVATADSSGRPSVRTVLCRGYGPTGLTFFTNHESAKGQDLTANPRAAAVFSWLAQERQVRFEGPVAPVSREETEAYVATRPADSVVGSWASPQSQVVASRAELDERVEAARAAGVHGAPPFWGGYRLTPVTVEFWQGRPDRLHDRLRFRALADGAWVVERLAP
ncbi:pyridoxamine 5'-phosphate oxidase [Jatrophihabitans sp. YIM 134969]